MLKQRAGTIIRGWILVAGVALLPACGGSAEVSAGNGVDDVGGNAAGGGGNAAGAGNGGDTCSDGQAAYRALLGQLLAAPPAGRCQVNSDCKYLSGSSACGDYCAGDVVTKLTANSIEPQLQQFGADHCSTCRFEAPPCVAPPSPLCSGGTCIIGGFE